MTDTNTPAAGVARRSRVLVLAAAAACVTLAGSPAASAALEPDAMIVYEAGVPIAQSELTDLGPPDGLGGTVLSGDPKISARVDHARDGVLAGVFQATPGTVMIDFPFTEHATIIDGAVTLADQWGNHATLRAGDSYLIRQGSKILWKVRGHAVQKSFFNRTEAVGSPAPMTIYRADDPVPETELTDLGPPEGLGGTVLAGEPRISARFDYLNDGGAAGVFQATRGDVLIDFPFTEHATVLAGDVELTDATGGSRRLRAGDSYLIRQASPIVWQVDKRRVQKSFFNVGED